jgi:hypothetical protein
MRVLSMEADRRDIHLDVGRTIDRKIVREVEGRLTDPVRWRDDPAAPIGAGLILRAIRCPQPPSPDALGEALDELRQHLAAGSDLHDRNIRSGHRRRRLSD